MLQRKSLFLIATLIALLLAGFATLSANAQAAQPATPPATPASPAPRGFGGQRGSGAEMLANSGALEAFRACSASDYAAVVAKSLSMTTTDLRVALVSGKSVQDLEKEKTVSSDTIRAAVVAAQKADLAQSVKDGVITQAQADFIAGLLDRTLTPATKNPSAATPPAAPPAPGGNAPRLFPPMQPAFNFGFTVSRNVPVHNYTVAAKAINISCAALLTAMQEGHQSIAQIAESKNVTAQTVIDALVKAHNDALDQEVKEGLITAAQKTGQSTRLTAQVTAFVNGRQGIGPMAFQGARPGLQTQPRQQGPQGLRGRFGNLACRAFGFFCGGQGQGNAPQPGNMAPPVPTQPS